VIESESQFEPEPSAISHYDPNKNGFDINELNAANHHLKIECLDVILQIEQHID